MKKDLSIKLNRVAIILLITFTYLIVAIFLINLSVSKENINISNTAIDNKEDVYNFVRFVEKLIYENQINYAKLSSFEETIFQSKLNLNPLYLNYYSIKVSDNLHFDYQIKPNTYLLILLGILYFSIVLIYLYIYNLISLSNLKLSHQSHIFSLSQKLAHDIRSPISTLNIISSKMNDPELKELQLAVVDKINSIANDLLNKSKGQLQSPDNIHQIKNSDKEAQISQTLNIQSDNTLSLFFKNLVKEYDFKKVAIQQKVIFQIQNEDLKKGRLSKSHEHILYQAINNFIQNSIDATNPTSGEIVILSQTNNHHQLEIVISDNGKGIPSEILQELGNKPLSHGKMNDSNSGNGIAIFNAKKDLLEMGIQLSIASQQNKGTQVVLKFSKFIY